MGAKEDILAGKTALGIEFGSTRIKAILIGKDNTPIASGSHEWENRYENGVWTYSLDDIWGGLTDCYASLKADVKEKYGVTLKRLGAIGFSAMMHGYMPFDKNGKQIKGYFDAFRKSDVESFLTVQGYKIAEIKPTKITKIGKFLTFSNEMRYKELTFFLTQLSTYIKSGCLIIGK